MTIYDIPEEIRKSRQGGHYFFNFIRSDQCVRGMVKHNKCKGHGKEQ